MHLEQEEVHGFGFVHGGGYDEHPSVGAQVGAPRDDRSHFPVVLVVVDNKVLRAHLPEHRTSSISDGHHKVHGQHLAASTEYHQNLLDLRRPGIQLAC
jgi:hypothetical protein